MRQHPRLLEISAWPWLERLSREERRHVTLGDVAPHRWDAIADGGFDLVFLMGVWRRSTIGREIARTHPELRAEYDRVLPGWTPEDVPGSPYCIQDYEPDPRMGGWQGLEEARRQLNARGVGLVLDFVPNHTGFDHPWVTSHPERYVLGTEPDFSADRQAFRPIERDGATHYVACGRDPYFAPWTDVAQLNYFNPDTRAAMRSTLQRIADHCDGVRCDMAMLVLNEVFERTWRRVLRERWPAPAEEFWPSATAGASGLTFIAEVYWGLEGRLIEHGFDFAYDKQLLDALHANDAGPRVRHALESTQPIAHHLARFIENHDEPRSADTLGERLAAAAVLIATTPGLRFFYDGQFDGSRVKAPVQLGRWPDETSDERIRTLYERVLRASRDPVFHDGEWRLASVSHAGDDTFHHIVAYHWKQAESVAVVAMNLAPFEAHAHVDVSGVIGPGQHFEFHDRLADARYQWTRQSLDDRGLYVKLRPGEAHVFKVTEVRS